MARRYDGRTTMFSPEGRLHQVEYAMKAIDQAGAAVGVLCSDGVVLGGERKVISKLLAPVKTSDKMYKVDSHIACAVAGLTSDANVLINRSRLVAQYHRLSFQEGQPVELLIQNVCDVMQSYTQFGGQRPFGVSFLFAGWDEHFGYQLYKTDPSGNYGGWKATAIGNNCQVAMDYFKKECKGEKKDDGEDTIKDPPTYRDGLGLAIKALSKAMDTTTLTPEKMEFAVLTRKNGKMVYRPLTDAETARMCAKVEAEMATEGDA